MSLFIYPLFAFAQESAVIEPMPSTDDLMKAINDRHWPLIISFTLMFAIWFVRYIFHSKLNAKYIPYIVVGCSIVSATTTRIVQFVGNNQTWWHGMIQGFIEGVTIGGTSMGLWSAGGKASLPNIQPSMATIKSNLLEVKSDLEDINKSNN
jgi:hypothetical protein